EAAAPDRTGPAGAAAGATPTPATPLRGRRSPRRGPAARPSPADAAAPPAAPARWARSATRAPSAVAYFSSFAEITIRLCIAAVNNAPHPPPGQIGRASGRERV